MSGNGLLRQLTATQRKMLKVLADGRPHTRKELHACLHDDLGSLGNIKRHISDIRKVLRQRGEDVVCELGYQRVICYRWIRLLKTATRLAQL